MGRQFLEPLFGFRAFVVFVFHGVIMRLMLALLLLVFVVPSPRNKGKNQAKPTDAQGQSDAQQTPIAPIPAVVKQTSPSQTETISPQEKNDTAPQPKPWMSHAEWVMAGLTFVYVVLTGVYVSYSAKTLRELQRQVGLIEKQDIATQRQLDISQMSAEAAMQGVALQQAQLRQWVETSDWTVTAPFLQPTTTESTVTVSFDLGNPTRLPLTLKAIRLTIEPVWQKKEQQSSSMGMHHALPPDNPYPLSIQLPIRGVFLDLYRNRKLDIVVAMDVEFADAFDVLRKQRFVVSGKCGPTNWHELSVSQNTHAEKFDKDNQ